MKVIDFLSKSESRPWWVPGRVPKWAKCSFLIFKHLEINSVVASRFAPRWSLSSARHEFLEQ